MKQIQSWLDCRKDSVWFSAVLNGVVLFLIMLVFYPFYETNDDMGILSLIGGSKGVYETHLVYINSFLGLLLRSLYQIRHDVPWYPLLQYLLLYLSFTSITFVMIRRCRQNSSVWFLLIFLLIFSYEGYVKLQYTKTAGIVTAAGLTLVFYAHVQEWVSRRAYLAGGVLALFGSMYRLNQFLCEFALFLGLGVFFLSWVRKFPRKEQMKRTAVCVGSFLCIFILALLIYKADRMTYSQEDWSYYLRFDEARSELLDYGFPDYSENEEAYEALGLDESAYQLLKKWTHSDSEKMTAEVLEALVDLKEPKRINRTLIADFFRIVPVRFIKITGFWCFGILFLLWLLRGNHGAGGILTVGTEILLVLLLYFYLYYRGRYLINRVDIGIWMTASVTLMWLFEAEKHVLPGWTGAVFFLAVLVLTQYKWQDNWRIRKTEAAEQRESAQEALEKIRADSDHLYLVKVGTISYAKAYGVWESMPFDIGGNTYPLGGWPAQTPTYLSVLEEYGIENPFRDMIGNDSVYLVDKKIEMTMEYIHQWYDENAEAVYIGKVGGYPVYQIK